MSKKLEIVEGFKEVPASQIIKECYIEYAHEVNGNRMVPSMIDGLLPVQRRMLTTLLMTSGSTNREDGVANMAIIGDTMKCFTGDTEVLTVNNERIPIKDLVDRVEKGENIYTFSSKSDGEIKVSKIIKVWKSKQDKEYIKITLDSGESVKCSLDHKFLLRNGTYEEANRLRIGDSLMPIYVNEVKSDNCKSGIRREYIDNKTGNSRFVYQISRNHKDCDKSKVVKNAINATHHIDFNSMNDNPDNLEIIPQNYHRKLHGKASLENYVKTGQLSLRNKEKFKDPEYREFISNLMSDTNRRYYGKYIEDVCKYLKNNNLDLDYNNYMKIFDSKEVEGFRISFEKIFCSNDYVSILESFDFNIDSIPKKYRLEPFDFLEDGYEWGQYKNCVDALEFLERENLELNYHNYHSLACDKLKELKGVNKIQIIDLPYLISKARNWVEENFELHISNWKGWCPNWLIEKYQENGWELNSRQSQQFWLALEIFTELRESNQPITPENYVKLRKHRNYPSWEYFKENYLADFEKYYNHKISNIEIIKSDKDIDFYDLQVDSEESNFSLGCGIIVHNCFHPHSLTGDVLTGMYKVPVPYVEGIGNWGHRGLNSTGKAADRYLHVALSERAEKELKELWKFSDFFLNENDYMEPVALPLPIPFSLLNGRSTTLGMGLSTSYPQCDEESLIKVVHEILNNKKDEELSYVKPTCLGQCIYNDEDLEHLNKEGWITVVERANIKEITYDGRKAYQITDIPYNVGVEVVVTEFKYYLDNNLMWLIDESNEEEGIKLIVGREKGVRQITDEEIYEKLIKKYKSKVTYNLFGVDIEGNAKRVTPHQILRESVNYCVKVFTRYLESRRDDLSEKIKFEQVKHRLAEMLLAKKSDESIQKELDLTPEIFSKFIKKSISTLRSEKKDTDKLENDLNEINKKLENPNLSYLEYFNSIR